MVMGVNVVDGFTWLCGLTWWMGSHGYRIMW